MHGESHVISQQFDERRPSWIHGQIETNLLKDKTSVINPFETIDRPYINFKELGLYPSSYKRYPELYKIVGYSINISDNR